MAASISKWNTTKQKTSDKETPSGKCDGKKLNSFDYKYVIMNTNEHEAKEKCQMAWGMTNTAYKLDY